MPSSPQGGLCSGIFAHPAAAVFRGPLELVFYGDGSRPPCLLLTQQEPPVFYPIGCGPSSKAWPATPPYSVMARITRQGLPAANTPSGMSRVTTLPAPMTDRDPTFTPGQRITPPPTHTSVATSTGLPNSCCRR